MKNKLFLILLILILCGCTDVKGSIEALKDQGLEPVEVGGYGWVACSDKDFYSTKFIAKRENGRIVKGVVCKGFFKGRTIRYK